MMHGRVSNFAFHHSYTTHTRFLIVVKYYLVELVNIVNIGVQFWMTNIFLDYEFRNVAVGGLNAEIHQSVMPIVAQCNYT